MPDQYGFDHLVNWGVVTHRCTVEGCDWPDSEQHVTERERRLHHERHQRQVARERARARDRNLAAGRRLQRQARRENDRG